jgi:uncharacterized membrane protein
MTIRSFATPITIASFLTVAVTGLLMLFGVHGGMMGLAHEISSVIFVLGSILHIVVNLRPTLAHLKRPVGATLAVLFLLFTAVAMAPLEHNKVDHRQAFMRSSELLLGLTPQELGSVTHQDKAAILQDLAKAGFKVEDENATLKAIAASNHREAFEALGAAMASVPFAGNHR